MAFYRTLVLLVALTLAGAPAGRLAAQEASVPEGWKSETRTVQTVVPEDEKTKTEITYLTNTVGMEFVRIPAGEFMMGSQYPAVKVARSFGGRTEDFRDERPRHAVRITEPFLAGAREVTREQFAQFIEETGYKTAAETSDTVLDRRTGGITELREADWQHPPFDVTGRHPVTGISHRDAVAFCKWLSKKEGRIYRLPTEAEWEYMCRAGFDQNVWWWGDDETDADKNGNFAADNQWRQTFKRLRGDDHKYAAPVGEYRPNPWGLYDILGNVWEWTADYYDPAYYAISPEEDPRGPDTGREHVLRGGAWYGPAYCRPAYRAPLSEAPEFGLQDVGFRVVCDPR